MRGDRAAILEKLDRGMGVRLTLLLIPDGTHDGSPEVMRCWLAERTWARARHTLTAADNGPRRFLRSLTAAVTPLVPAGLRRAPSVEPSLLDATGELLNSLLTVEEDFALVLEDYHVITAEAIHSAITLMVSYPPPRMHVYLVSQTVPPLPLPRLRVRQQLVEIDMRGREPTGSGWG
jgi:LuxR family maltose regulon positive regulatory protein